MKQTIKVIDMYRTDTYERNYDIALDHGADFDTTCICCGRKLNPKTMKQIQGLAPGYFVDPSVPNIPERYSETLHQEPMGWYSVGPICYREIRRRLAASTTTVEIEL
jgi:hypothetical protein